MMKPYYQDDAVTIYHGDCRDVLPTLNGDYAIVTDPPYPNNAGHFDADVLASRDLLGRAGLARDAIVFWGELERPPVPLPLVAIHIWHRANVNGRPYESVYHFAPDGIKRRSDIYRHAVEFENATGAEYLGHPTQKPVALMHRLVRKTAAPIIIDPFAGVGSTLRAVKDLGLRAIGVEIEERYCEIAALRCSQEVLPLKGAA